MAIHLRKVWPQMTRFGIVAIKIIVTTTRVMGDRRKERQRKDRWLYRQGLDLVSSKPVHTVNPSRR